MIDAGCWMLDVQEYSNSEIQKDPVSRGQYPGSANAGKGFRLNSLDELQYFMQLGVFISQDHKIYVKFLHIVVQIIKRY